MAGKPRYQPTDDDRKNVKALTSFGVTQTEIAQYLGIDPKTLRLYFRDELDKSAINANAAVARVLYEKAVIQRETAAVIFWLKTRARWKETERHEHTGGDGKPIEVQAEYKELDDMVKSRVDKILSEKDDANG